jgi:hypothetical protein
MEGYSSIFNDAESKFKTYSEHNDVNPVFQSFRVQRDFFGFIDNGDIPPDEEAITIAKSINTNIFDYYMNQIKNRKLIGYEGSTSNYAGFTHVDSRHIMMNTIIYHVINENKLKNIIEIGGGFANWLYLNRNRPITKWTIIDLPHIIQLQKWCLDQHTIPGSMYQLLSAYDYEEASYKEYDIVIGTHSLSEFSLDVFINYFNKIIRQSTYLFYCYHKWAHYEMVNLKRQLIDQHFDLLYEIPTENGNVSNCLFVNRYKNNNTL